MKIIFLILILSLANVHLMDDILFDYDETTTASSDTSDSPTTPEPSRQVFALPITGLDELSKIKDILEVLNFHIYTFNQ